MLFPRNKKVLILFKNNNLFVFFFRTNPFLQWLTKINWFYFIKILVGHLFSSCGPNFDELPMSWLINLQ